MYKASFVNRYLINIWFLLLYGDDTKSKNFLKNYYNTEGIEGISTSA